MGEDRTGVSRKLRMLAEVMRSRAESTEDAADRAGLLEHARELDDRASTLEAERIANFNSRLGRSSG